MQELASHTWDKDIEANKKTLIVGLWVFGALFIPNMTISQPQKRRQKDRLLFLKWIHLNIVLNTFSTK